MTGRALLLLPLLFLASCASASFPVSPRTGAIPAADIRQVASQGAAALAPGIRKGKHNIFEFYSAKGKSLIADKALAPLDFSGIAMDNPRTATLISPQHVAMAAHFTRGPGSRLIFHDRSGNRQEAFIIAVEKVKLSPGGSSTDIAIGRLDRSLPLTTYRVLPPRSDYRELLNGAKVLVTEQGRHVYIHTIRGVNPAHVSLGPSTDLLGVNGKIRSGDSGNPSFLLINGELVLLETHTTGGFGAGPFYSAPEVFAGINAAMRKLGGGYQLSTVNVR